MLALLGALRCKAALEDSSFDGEPRHCLATRIRVIAFLHFCQIRIQDCPRESADPLEHPRTSPPFDFSRRMLLRLTVHAFSVMFFVSISSSIINIRYQPPQRRRHHSIRIHDEMSDVLGSAVD